MVGGTLCTDLHGSIPEERMRNGICVLKRTHRRPMPVSRSMCVCVCVCACVAGAAAACFIALPPIVWKFT